LFVDPHPASHQSNIGVQSRKQTEEHPDAFKDLDPFLTQQHLQGATRLPTGIGRTLFNYPFGKLFAEDLLASSVTDVLTPSVLTQ
jgi:hypothetical protein